MTLAKAVQSAPACAYCGSTDRGTLRVTVAIRNAYGCDECTQSIADAVLVAAREDWTAWALATPTSILQATLDGPWGINPDLHGAIYAELRRREKEETR